jgi:hypothetical protein
MSKEWMSTLIVSDTRLKPAAGIEAPDLSLTDEMRMNR